MVSGAKCYLYIYTYIHICSMCYWCHWCSTVFFKKSANRKSVGGSRESRESRLLRRAGDADQVHAGPWNWESRELGPDRDPGALAEGMSHPLFVIGGELGDWLLGEGGSQWAMGHGPSCLGKFRLKKMHVFCWKSVHCFWRKHTKLRSFGFVPGVQSLPLGARQICKQHIQFTRRWAYRFWKSMEVP